MHVRVGAVPLVSLDDRDRDVSVCFLLNAAYVTANVTSAGAFLPRRGMPVGHACVWYAEGFAGLGSELSCHISDYSIATQYTFSPLADYEQTSSWSRHHFTDVKVTLTTSLFLNELSSVRVK